MFIEALFTIDKTWKQPKCLWTDEQVRKMWTMCIYNGMLVGHEKEWHIAICSNTDEPRDDHTEWSRERQFYDITYMCNLKNNTMNLFTK